jgi:hypothetical protein
MHDSLKIASLLGVLISSGSVLAQQPTDAQISAIRSACRGDYHSVCADVPTGGKPALQCLQQHADAVSNGCREALAPLGAPAAAAATAPASVGAPAAAARSPVPAAPAPSVPPMSMHQQAQLLRNDCSSDFHKLCSGVQLGGGRAVACLQSHASQLSQLCQSALLAAQKK